MYAIWCKLKSGEEGWYSGVYEHEVYLADGEDSGMCLMDDKIRATRYAGLHAKISNVLSAEAREVVVVEARELTRLRLLDAYQKAWASAADANANHALGDCTEEEFDEANNAMKAAYDALKACDTTVKRTLIEDSELERLRLAESVANAHYHYEKESAEYHACRCGRNHEKDPESCPQFHIEQSAANYLEQCVETYRAHVAKEQADATT